MQLTLEAALLRGSRVGSDLGLEYGLVEELCQLGLFCKFFQEGVNALRPCKIKGLFF